ncbi:MAG: hydroxyacid dehydrogenase [Candidatus Poribacteria bacterium]|nr:hydroxyacid dehydrogenase [Candidatus Poribacteria bacterium]
MQRAVPKILYVCSPSHTKLVFQQEHYTRLQTYFDFHANPKEDRYTSAQLADEIGGCDALITGWGAPKITPDVMKNADKLKLIAHSAGSVRGMLDDVIDTIRERGIRVFGANRAIALNVAEQTIGLLIMHSQRWYDHITVIREGGWRSDVPKNGQFLRGSTVGLVSMSTVAREVLPLLKPFTTDILAYDPYLTDYDAGRLGVERVDDLSELFARSDFVSSHAPSLPETDKMIGLEQLSKLRPGGVFINTSRGSVIDHEALTEVAKRGQIQVHLDVSSPEPLPVDHPLRSLPNVYFTPHTAGAGYYGYHKIGEFTLASVENFFAGKPFDGEVNLDRWTTLA